MGQSVFKVYVLDEQNNLSDSNFKGQIVMERFEQKGVKVKVLNWPPNFLALKLIEHL